MPEQYRMPNISANVSSGLVSLCIAQMGTVPTPGELGRAN